MDSYFRDRPVHLRFRSLEVRLAETQDEIQAAQSLRYQVFYDEMNAIPTAEMARIRRDFDRFDAICDHLLVIDTLADAPTPHVVGTYRLLRRSVAMQHQGFYSADEYDLSSLMDYPGEIVECGRSCVDGDYRTGAVMQILWRGIAEYLAYHDIQLMFGCASLPGTDPTAMKQALGYLHQHHLAPQELRPRALDHHYVDLSSFECTAGSPREAMSALPPLIKGYVRLGGYVGDGAVVDHQFNTTDVCVIVPCNQITQKYHRHYKPSATR